MDDSASASVTVPSVWEETSRERAEREKQREAEREREQEARLQQMSMNAILKKLADRVAGVFQRVFRSTLPIEEMRNLSTEFPVGFDPSCTKRERYFVQTDESGPGQVRLGHILVIKKLHFLKKNMNSI